MSERKKVAEMTTVEILEAFAQDHRDSDRPAVAAALQERADRLRDGIDLLEARKRDGLHFGKYDEAELLGLRAINAPAPRVSQPGPERELCRECGHAYWEHMRDEPMPCALCLCNAFDGVKVPDGKLIKASRITKPDPKKSVSPGTPEGPRCQTEDENEH